MEGIFIGQIMLWSGSWVPYGFVACDGTLYGVSQFAALYSIIGNRWGGSGNAFKVPDLRGKTLAGYGPNVYGVTPLPLAQTYEGETAVQLTVGQMPAHNHSVNIPNANAAVQAKAVVSNLDATSANPTGLVPAAGYSPSPDSLDINLYTPQAGAQTIGLNNSVQLNVTTTISSLSLANTGGGVAHTNMQPYLSMYYIIAWAGNYPDFQD